MSDSTSPPLVSIIVPTYDRAALLARSLRSLLAQTYADFEILVVDDASQDDTEEVVRRCDDARIRYFRLARNGGPAVARNHGLERSRGAFLAFQDSDDEWTPDKLARQMLAFRDSSADVGVIYCDMLRIRRDGSRAYHRSPDIAKGRWLNPATRFYQPYGLGISSSLIRRASLEAAGQFDERYRCFEDLELLMRLAHVCEFSRIPVAMVHYYETGGQTAMWQAELSARRLLLRSHGAALFGEDRRFVLAEVGLTLTRTLLGPLAKGWLGRPQGPPPT